MNTNYNTLPLPVLSAIVAHFEHNLDELRFGHNIVNIMINSDTVTALPRGEWIMEAVHVSGEDVVIVATAEEVVSVEIVCPHCKVARKF